MFIRALRARAEKIDSTLKMSHTARKTKEHQDNIRTQIVSGGREKTGPEETETTEYKKAKQEVDKVVKSAKQQLGRKLFQIKFSNFLLYFRYYIFPAILLFGVVAATFYIAKPYFDNGFPSKQNETGSQAITPQPSLTTTRITDANGVSMIFIPAGDFIMGNDNGYDDEKPAHTIYLDAFYIDEYEVTNALYNICISEGACDSPRGGGSRYKDATYAQHPVTNVNWFMAKIYCEWRGGRLPTEAEWEKTARGEDAFVYPWGNDFNGNVLNFCDRSCEEFNNPNEIYDDGYVYTSPVGTYPDGVSPYGVYDMAGNVWEWTSSGYRIYPYDANDGREELNRNNYRVLRGGAFDSDEDKLITYNRLQLDSGYPLYNVGFRCACDADS